MSEEQDDKDDGGFAGAMMKELQQVVADKFKDDDDITDGDPAYVSPYSHLEKAAVLQEARIFHDGNAVRENPRRCCTVIAQLLHLQNTGQHLNGPEATDVFFGVTKLFMSEDASLRRMVYLFIKDVAETCNPDDVIIVTSSLTKDMTCDVDLYRGNALRVLARIVDGAMLGAIERYVKQAIVDSSAQVSSSALVSACHLFRQTSENAAVVRRWIGEVQEATTSPNEMVQFHAIQLLYLIKKEDRLGVSKLVQQFSQKNSLKSPMAVVCLVRFTSKLLRDEVSSGMASVTVGGGYKSADATPLAASGYTFLENSLNHSSEIVVYEAARAICQLPSAEPQDISPAISVLQQQIASTKPATRHAAMRTIAFVAVRQPRLVARCNEALEALVQDPNRSIATLAITTLLETGPENSIDRLLKQISAFFSDIADEHKISVVESLRKLCFTHPTKHQVIVGFMSNFLREEGGFEFKKTIVDAIISLLRAVPETVEISLLQLCEFIEDCEFTALSTSILHLIGDVGPTAPAPARYIRFLYNRVILENAAVRAAAVSALAKFAAKCPSLRASVLTLLRRSLHDEDDETRDRTTMAVAVLDETEQLCPYTPPTENTEDDDGAGDDDDAHNTHPSVAAVNEDLDPASFVLLSSLPVSFEGLRRRMEAYGNTPAHMQDDETPLTFSVLPVIEDLPNDTTANGYSASSSSKDNIDIFSSADSNDPAADAQLDATPSDPAEYVHSLPELAHLGRAFRSSPRVHLTENETEYVVSCVKHIFQSHVVLDFSVRNTIDDQRLEDVTVALEAEGESGLEPSGEIAASSIAYGDVGRCLSVLDRDPDASTDGGIGTFACVLQFRVAVVDPTTGEDEGQTFEEEYPLEDVELKTSDYVAGVAVPDFKGAWASLGSTNEILEKYALQFDSIPAAVDGILRILGMRPCDGTGVVKGSASVPGGGGKPHMLHASGMFLGGGQILVRAQVAEAKNADGSIVLKIAVRSDKPDIPRTIVDCIS